MQFTTYEMKADIAKIESNVSIHCIPFEERFFEEYKKMYNESFWEMRKSLDIKPYDFLSDYAQIRDKIEDIFILVDNGELVGSVACYGNEIDDLFVGKQFQGKGIGKQLLLWGMNYIRIKYNSSIHLHVAEWNKKAVMLYRSVGFTIVKTEIISR